MTGARALVVCAAFIAAACDGGAGGRGGADVGLDPDVGVDVADDSGSAGAVVYVDRAAAPGGDGSAAAPFATVAEAIAAQTDGAGGALELRIAAGDYSVDPVEGSIGVDVVVRGAGAGVTELTIASPTRWSTAASLAVEALTVHGDLTLESATMRASALGLAEGAALRATGGTLELAAITADGARVSLVDLQSATLTNLTFGASSLEAETVGALEAFDLAFTAPVAPGLRLANVVGSLELVVFEATVAAPGAEPAATVEVDGGEVTASDWRVYSSPGAAISLRNGASLTLDRADLVGAGGALLDAQGADVVVRESDLGDAVRAVFAVDADVTISDTTIERLTAHGVLATGGTLDLNSVVLRECGAACVSLAGPLSVAIIESSITTAADACLAITGAVGAVNVTASSASGCVGAGISLLESSGAVVDRVDVSAVSADPATGAGAAIAVGDGDASIVSSVIHDSPGTGISVIRAAVAIDDVDLMNLGGAGVDLVGRASAPSVVTNTRINSASVAGVFVTESAAEIRRSVIDGTRYDAEFGLGDGVVFGGAADVVVVDNTIRLCAGNGVTFFSGATGTVESNRFEANGGFGVQEFCVDDVASPVAIGANEYVDNAAGTYSTCSVP